MGLKKPADRMHRSDQLGSLDRGADNGVRLKGRWEVSRVGGDVQVNAGVAMAEDLLEIFVGYKA